MKCQCLHVGAGRLGLGMVIPAFVSVGITPQVLIGARRDASPETVSVESILSSESRYFLHHSACLTRAEDLVFEVPCSTVTPSDVVIESDVDAHFVTLAVGPEIDAVSADAVRKYVDAANAASRPVIVLPCENRVSDAYLFFLAELAASGAYVLQQVVDRICTERHTYGNDVFVSTEAFWQWIIEVPPGLEQVRATVGEVFADHVRNGNVAFVDDAAPYRARKARMVNAIHMAIALKLLVQRPTPQFATTDDFVSNCEGISEMVEAIQTAMISSILDDHPDTFTEKDLHEYAVSIEERLRTEPDTAARILARLRKPELAEFILSYGERVHLPLVKYDPVYASELADDLFQVIARRQLGSGVIDMIIRSMRSPTEEDE